MRLIDGDALARELLSLTWLGCDGGYYKGMADERDSTLQRIADAPEMQGIKHGHWFFTEYEYFTCSVCGEEYFNSSGSTATTKRMLENGEAFKFCPHCGADMRTENQHDS